MKSWIMPCALLIFIATTIDTYATSPGFYLGAMAGLARNSGKEQLARLDGEPTIVEPKDRMGAFRLYMGYRFNWWAGWEFGGTIYTPVEYESSFDSDTSIKTGLATIDLVAVGYVSIAELFDIFGKIGPAVVYERASSNITKLADDKSHRIGITPTFSLGVGYNLTPNWLLDLTWTRLVNTKYLGKVDTVSLGISYHFVNRYCGQFLCDD